MSDTSAFFSWHLLQVTCLEEAGSEKGEISYMTSYCAVEEITTQVQCNSNKESLSVDIASCRCLLSYLQMRPQKEVRENFGENFGE